MSTEMTPERKKRFYKMWAIATVEAFAVFLTLIATFVITIAAMFTWPVVVIPIILLSVIGGFAATVAHSLARDKLEKIEREEQRTLDLLKRDYDRKVA